MEQRGHPRRQVGGMEAASVVNAPGSLLLPGLASALVYLLAFTLPYWLPAYYLNVEDEIYQFAAREPWRGGLFYAALALLFAFYLIALRLVGRQERGRSGVWWVGVSALVFCLLLIPVQPITSSDLYGYVFQGRIVAVLGENPFAHRYNDFAADPFYFCVTFRRLPATTGYGPLWIAIEAALGWLARDRLLLNLFLFKGLAAGFHLLSALLVYVALKAVAPNQSVAGMLFYAWNPLLLYELVGNGHNDAAVAAFALLGFCLLARSRGLLAIPCLAAAALIKPVAVLWLPLAAVWLLAQCGDRPVRLRRAVAIGLLAIVPAVAVYAPFWAGAMTFRGLLAQSDIHGNSLPNLLIRGLAGVWPQANAQIVQGVKLLTALAFAPFYLSRLWSARHDLVRSCFDVMLFYLLFVGFQFMPWYVTWLMVPAALIAGPTLGPRRSAAVVLCLLALLLYFPFGWQWVMYHLPAWGVALLSSGPIVGAGLWLAVWPRQEKPASA